MNEVMTVPEIEARFNSEWVLLEDVQVNEAGEIASGAVLYHSKDRDEVYRKAVELRPQRFATLYTGKMPPNSALVL
jgi:hypothetical protein